MNASINREWMVNIGKRQAASRLAHLFRDMLLLSWEPSQLPAVPQSKPN